MLTRRTVAMLLLLSGVGVAAGVTWARWFFREEHIEVAGTAASRAALRIYKGSYSIDRASDAELFADSRGSRLVFDGHSSPGFDADYGENDFLALLDDKWYFQFRHFKFNWKDRHSYLFNVRVDHGQPFLSVEIGGPSPMLFERPMVSIADAARRRCNVPIDPAAVLFNGLELVQPRHGPPPDGG